MSKPLEMYYAERKKHFDSTDQDLIDKAERYFESKLESFDRWAEYETDPEILRLIKFCNWAKLRGGLDAFSNMKNVNKSNMDVNDTEK